MIPLIFYILIIGLWILGGQTKGRYRDVPVPILIAGFCAFHLWVWWLFFVLSATFQVVRFGYGNYDPEHDDKPSHLAALTHDRNGWWIRALWGFLVSAIGAFALWKFGYLMLWKYACYVMLNTVINFLVSRLRLGVFLTDTFISASLGSIIFLI